MLTVAEPAKSAGRKLNTEVHRRTFEKILIVRLSSLGDVIQTLPVPTVIRQAFPRAEIGWAIDRELAPAIAGHPAIDHIHLCDRNRWSRLLKNPLAWRRILGEARQFIAEVRAVGYDCALDVQGLLKSAVIPYIARISPRIGFGHNRELTHVFYTEHYLSKAQYFDPNCMHTDHMMILARAIGCETDNYAIAPPEVPDACRASINRLLQPLERDLPLVAMAPATQWRSKQWPPENWFSLIRLVLQRSEARVILIGSAADRAMITRLMAQLGGAAGRRVLSLAGMTSVPELYALFERVTVMVAADTAPLHIAAAAGCRLIGLFGATPVRRTGPLGLQARMVLMSAQPQLACQPCQQRVCPLGTLACMWNLKPEDVFARLREAIAVEQGEPAIDARGNQASSRSQSVHG